MIRIAIIVTALLATFALRAQAADVMVGHLKLSSAWARATRQCRWRIHDHHQYGQ
jgi:hypothetical protein